MAYINIFPSKYLLLCFQSHSCIRTTSINTNTHSRQLHINAFLRASVATLPGEEVGERIRRRLRGGLEDPIAGMEFMDKLQWLGISYHYKEEIDLLLEKLQDWDAPGHSEAADLHAAAMQFRLLRQNARPVTSDCFKKFMIKKQQDEEALLSLYEASYLGVHGEHALLEARKIVEAELKSFIGSTQPQQMMSRRINRALELPRHMRMERLESRLYIDEYRKENNHSELLVHHAISDYNSVQSMYRMEHTGLLRWWKKLGLIEKLGFARDRLDECFLWTIGIVPEPKYSSARIEVAKAVALLTVIDDVFDMYGPINELYLFTNAIRRWELDAIDHLPEYMRICYMALYSTTNEIAFKVLHEQGRNILPFLAKAWIDTIEAYMIEAKWFHNGNIPHVEDYVKNGVATSGSYMALVHVFFLMGEGLTTQNVKLMTKPYPNIFSTSGTILRLWDDLGTTKEEQDLGDNASIITSLLNEKKISSEGEAQKHIQGLILNLWEDLNGELLAGSNTLPFSLINACFNMARTSQVIYQHKEDTYFSNVEKFINFVLLDPIN